MVLLMKIENRSFFLLLLSVSPSFSSFTKSRHHYRTTCFTFWRVLLHNMCEKSHPMYVASYKLQPSKYFSKDQIVIMSSIFTFFALPGYMWRKSIVLQNDLQEKRIAGLSSQCLWLAQGRWGRLVTDLKKNKRTRQKEEGEEKNGKENAVFLAHFSCLIFPVVQSSKSGSQLITLNLFSETTLKRRESERYCTRKLSSSELCFCCALLCERSLDTPQTLLTQLAV